MTNMHDMHMDRLQIFSRIHSCASRVHPRSSYGVKKGHFGVKNLKYVQMHIIYIWIDSEFYFDSNSENVQVIGGHPRGHIRSFWGEKSEIRPNAHNIHMDINKYMHII